MENLRNMTLAEKLHQKLVNAFSSTFFHGSDAPGLQKSVRGTSQGPPGDSPAGFFGPGWLTPSGSYADLVGLKSHSEALRRLKVPQEALRGAPRRHFYSNFSKI